MNFSLLISLFLLIGAASAATFTVRNNCGFPVWPADIPAGGGTRLNPGETWTYFVPAGTAGGRVWGRVGCSPDGSNCETGDCGGGLQCRVNGRGVSGRPPATLAEYTLNGGNNLDYLDISLVDGFNLPMEFAANSGGCSQGRRCTADINGQCPAELRVPGGCNNRQGYADFFKQRCPGAYSHPNDDPTSIFTCPGGADYRVVFCP